MVLSTAAVATRAAVGRHNEANQGLTFHSDRIFPMLKLGSVVRLECGTSSYFPRYEISNYDMTTLYAMHSPHESAQT